MFILQQEIFYNYNTPYVPFIYYITVIILLYYFNYYIPYKCNLDFSHCFELIYFENKNVLSTKKKKFSNSLYLNYYITLHYIILY